MNTALLFLTRLLSEWCICYDDVIAPFLSFVVTQTMEYQILILQNRSVLIHIVVTVTSSKRQYMAIGIMEGDLICI